MKLYQVSAVFSDGIRYPAVEADSEQEAKARVAHAFAPDNGFYYCEAASPMDCLITREEFPLPEETTPLPHKENPGGMFCPGCGEGNDILRMETPTGEVMAWCPCGRVYLTTNDGVTNIGSTYKDDAIFLARKLLCEEYIRKLPSAYTMYKESFIEYMAEHCDAIYNDFCGDTGIVRAKALELTFRNYRNGTMPDQG